MPIDMSLLKEFHCVLTVPKGGSCPTAAEERLLVSCAKS
jgi:hypothetical protein